MKKTFLTTLSFSLFVSVVFACTPAPDCRMLYRDQNSVDYKSCKEKEDARHAEYAKELNARREAEYQENKKKLLVYTSDVQGMSSHKDFAKVWTVFKESAGPCSYSYSESAYYMKKKLLYPIIGISFTAIGWLALILYRKNARENLI